MTTPTQTAQKKKYVLNEEQKDRIKWLKENKCQEEDCYNFAEKGYIYCVLHLHGFPQKMDTEDIILLNLDEEQNDQPN